MKTSILLLLSLVTLAFAGTEVTDAGRVTLDGVDIGTVADAAKNGLVTPSAVHTALVAQLDALKAERDAAKVELAQTQTFAAEIIANAKALLAAPDETTLTKLAALLDQAATPAKDREIARLEAEKAKLEAELAAKRAAAGQ